MDTAYFDKDQKKRGIFHSILINKQKSLRLCRQKDLVPVFRLLDLNMLQR